MPRRHELTRDTERAVDAVRSAAADVIDAGYAELGVSTVTSLWSGDVEYDTPVVVLTPRDPAAARVRLEVQYAGIWVLSAANGPHMEF